MNVAFASGNGLNRVPPFVTSPVSLDLEDDLEDINGRNRDHLRTAWYRYQRGLSADSSFSITAGIIDATEFLDTNRFADHSIITLSSDVQYLHDARRGASNVDGVVPGLRLVWRY